MLKIHLDKNCSYAAPEIIYTLRIWAQSQGVVFDLSDTPDGALRVGTSEGSHLRLSTWEKVPPGTRFAENGLLVSKDSELPDYLATAFYMLNSVQEYTEAKDELGRFPYSASYQCRLGNIKENIVQHCFEEVARSFGLTPAKKCTRYFLSHDIDSVHGSLIEDGYHVLKRGRIDHFFSLLFNVAMGKPDWLNMDKIMKIESEYDCKSVFFWIVNKGSHGRIKNADYTFHSRRIQHMVNAIERKGFENGLHKSLSADTMAEELKRFGRKPISNRFHYLTFRLPGAYQAIEDARLKIDASLGFAEEIGFRNSYGLPFNPYDHRFRKPFTFVEVPLHLMDRTYFHYKKYGIQKAEEEVVAFFEKNRENCVLSILWHNNFFTNHKYQGYLQLYKRLLEYIRENKFKTLSQQEIIDEYALT